MGTILARRILQHIEKEKKKYGLWAFLENHGGSGSRYSSGYFQALEDLEEEIKKADRLDQESRQLTLF